MSNDPDMIQKHGHRDPFKILYTFFLSCHQRCCWLLHFFVIVVLLLSVGIVVVAVANHLICDSWMFLKFCWSIGLSFSLFILLFLFAFQGGLEVPSIRPSPTVHGAQLPLSQHVTAAAVPLSGWGPTTWVSANLGPWRRALMLARGPQTWLERSVAVPF